MTKYIKDVKDNTSRGVFQDIWKKLRQLEFTIGNGNGGNQNLQQVTDEGNTTNNDIEVVKLNANKTISVRTSGMFEKQTGISSSLGLFFRNTLGTTFLNIGNNTEDRILSLPDENGTLATQEYVDGFVPNLNEVVSEGNEVINNAILLHNNIAPGPTQSFINIGNDWITFKPLNSTSPSILGADPTLLFDLSYLNPQGGPITKFNNQSPPGTPTDFGYPGEIRKNATHIYLCVNANFIAGTATWVRSPIETTW